MHCSLDLRRIGAVVCCPRSVSLCRMQLPEARLGPSVRRGFGAERPSWLRGHGWGLGAEGLLAPNPASPRRKTRGEWVSAAETPSKAAGPGSQGQLYPLCPMESVGPGPKKACVAFWIRGTLGLWIAARGDFRFAECSCQKLVLGVPCDGASALSGQAGSGGMAGAWAQNFFARPILLPHEGEPVGRRFWRPKTPSKAAGLWQPGAALPCVALWRAEGRGRKRLALLSRSEARWGCGLLPEESFPLQNAAARSSFGAFRVMGPRR